MATRADLARPETRKVQLIGGATFAVSLPKHWAETVHLRPGDEMQLRLQPDGSVLLIPRRDPGPPQPPRVLETRGLLPEELLRALIGLYLAGEERIAVKHAGPLTAELRRAVDEACDRLRGLQVMEETAQGLVLQDLSDTEDLNVHKVLRLMHLNAHRMLLDAERAFGGGAAEALAAMERKEAELDRLLMLLLKQHTLLLRSRRFGAETGVGAEESVGYVLVAQALERVGDYATRIAGAVAAAGSRSADCPVAGKVREVLRDAAVLLEDATSAFERRDLVLANKVIARAAAASDAARNLALHLRPSPGVTVECYTVLLATERIALYAKGIGEAAINRAMLAPPA